VITLAKENVKTVAINLLTCLILALVVESTLYFCLQFPRIIPDFLLSTFRTYYLYSDRRIIQVTDCAQYDSSLFYTLKPGTSIFENREFSMISHVNSLGLRDDENSLRNPKIIFLGDSYTMGWGVQQDETFPQILERLTNMKTLNAGVSSYGTAREMILLNKLNAERVPYIFFQYHTNDFEENTRFLGNNNSLPIRSREQYDSLKNAIGSRERYFPFKHLYGISKAFAKGIILDKSKGPDPVTEAQAFLSVLKKSGINRYSARLVLFKIDDLEGLNNKFVMAIDSLTDTPEFQEIDIACFDFSKDLTEEDYFVLDDHLNPSGHIKIATKLKEALF
jgi:lysophospholipase L1-like esterase